jgi:hypothetical protein
MARSTGALAPVRIDSSNTMIRPASKNGQCQLAFGCVFDFRAFDFNDCAMAVKTGISICFFIG